MRRLQKPHERESSGYKQDALNAVEEVRSNRSGDQICALYKTRRRTDESD
jgi:hypothetical protein